MKKLLFILTVILTTPLSLLADSGSSQTPSDNGSAVLDLIKKDPDIKRMPSRNHLTVVYENGIITLSSEYYEGEFLLRFVSWYSGDCFEVYNISVGESVMFKLEYGEYEVYAFGEDGLVLAGIMEVF